MNQAYHNKQWKDEYPVKSERGEDRCRRHSERSFPHTLWKQKSFDEWL